MGQPHPPPPRRRAFLRAAALLLFLQVILVTAGPPRRLTDWLNVANLPPHPAPRHVVVLGGSGVPSDHTLLRLYYAAQFGRLLTNTTFIVALPTDDAPETSSVGRMRDELILRGIPADAIRLEHHGRSTHEQAVAVHAMLSAEDRQAPLVVVSSGYHLRRAVLTFRRAGFADVTALNAANVGTEAAPGWFAWLRYGLWNNWSASAQIIRELIALAAYKLRGWA